MVLHFVSCCDAAHICPASLPALCRIMLPSLPESRHYIMLPGFFFPSRMSLASSCLPPCTVHYIMLPGFFFPSRMSLASFTLAAMKLLPPDEGGSEAMGGIRCDGDGVLDRENMKRADRCQSPESRLYASLG